MFIYETEHFVVEAPDKPHIPRNDGGHVKIFNKEKKQDRLLLTPLENVELAWITSLVGQAFTTVMRKNGVNIERLNYQDNGNWCYIENKLPYLHVHIYGRTFDSKTQPLPNSLKFPLRSTGFYNGFEPLTQKDVDDIKLEIEKLSKTEKFDKNLWRFN